jgi:hypothetical protein
MVDRRRRIENDVVGFSLQLADVLDQFQPRHLAHVELQVRIEQWRRLGPAKRALLRIEVDQQHRGADGMETAPQLHGDRGLAGTAFLRDDSDHPA